MAYTIEIDASGDTFQRQLNDGSNILGLSDDCNIRVQNSELQEQSLHIDVRSEDVWVQNLNPYPIYVGEEEVSSNAWSNWEEQDEIQLTKSISVRLLKIVPQQEDDEEVIKTDGKSTGLDIGKLLQIILIVVCFTLAPIILFSGSDETVSATEVLDFDLDETLDSLESEITNPEVRQIRNRLQLAWIADQRMVSSSFDNQNVVKAYERLGSCRLLDSKLLDRTKLRSGTKEAILSIASFTQDRLVSLTQ